MKKLLTISLMLLAGVVLLAGCTKRDYYEDTREYALVVDYVEGYPYSVIRFDADGTFAVIESLDNNADYWPLINDELFGDFDLGSRYVRNNDAGYNIRISVLDYANSLNEANHILDSYIDRYGFAKKMSSVRAKGRGGESQPVIIK